MTERTGVLQWTHADRSASVGDRFARVADIVADRTAVADFGGLELSYRELLGVSSQVAGDVLRVCPVGSKIGLLSDLSVGTIAGLLGIVRAGCAYVPLDAEEPIPKARDKVVTAGVSVIVVTPGLEVQAAEIAPDCKVVTVDLGADGSEEPLPQVPSDAHFNLIFTSGSTGVPKGVIQVHENVLFDTEASHGLTPISPQDVFGLAIPLTFGASVADVMGALLNGARLELFDLRVNGIVVMSDWMAEKRITITHLVPTVLRRWLSSIEGRGRYPDMRLIRAGGEPMFRSDLELFASRFDTGLLRNGLGTTETYLVASELYGPDDTVDSEILPIGTPAPGRTVTIVGEDGAPVVEGGTGEIHVSSRYLSPGYWNDPEATAAAYADDGLSGVRTYRTGDLGRFRPDGRLEHLGRVDDMVKISGQRVHLTSVETVIKSLPGVGEACVVAKRTKAGDSRLVAYVVADEDFRGEVRSRGLLVGRIPSHLIPSRIVALSTLPTLPFGKVDRRALTLRVEDGEADSPAYRQPVGEIEAALAAAAAGALGVDRVGVDQDLFGLGLDSLSAVQMLARVRVSLGLDVPVGAVFENPTVESLAASIREVKRSSVEADLESLLAEVEVVGETGAGEALDVRRL